ncbi:MAG: SBBP repeat-containing protein [Armatimonadetes bacterium]|nr:SBBP repeat-containing protein [Armatimonadota bacterium]
MATAQPSASPFQGDSIQPANPVSATKALGKVRSMFQENKGQWDSRAKYFTRSRGLDYWVTDSGAVLNYYTFKNGLNGPIKEGSVVRMEVVGATGAATSAGFKPLDTHIDYVGIGTGRKAKGVGAYAEAYQYNLRPGVDMRHYRDNGTPRWDINIAGGVDPNTVKLEFTGADGLEIDSNGDLLIRTAAGIARQAGLKAYQPVGNSRVPVAASFVKLSDTQVGFRFGAYDRSQKLVVDPMVYGTYVGGDFDYDETNASVSNNNGQLYITGSTYSADFPITAGPYSINIKSSPDIGVTDTYIVALTGDAYEAVYIAFIGGVGNDNGKGIQVDQYGNVWLAGETDSGSFAKDLHNRIRSVSTDPTAGTFELRWNGNGDGLSFNTTAAQVATTLNDWAGPGTFTTTGGPLPGTPIDIFATGNDFSPTVVVNSKVWPYTLTVGALGTSIAWTAPSYNPNGDYGFRPTAGTFRIRNTTANTVTANLPWNATTQNVIDALVATGLNPAEFSTLVPNNRLPLQSLDFNRSGTAATQNLVIDAAGLRDGSYSGVFPQRIFLMRFEASAVSVLDPFSPEVIYTVGGDPNPVETFGGFQLKPVATAAGDVDIIIAGTTQGALSDVGAAVPDTFPAGFVARYRYTNNAASVTPRVAQSIYVGGERRTFASGLAVDGSGSAYVTGYVVSPNNVVTGPTSTVFVTTSGVFTNGNLLRFTDSFIRKYDADGTLRLSALLGGNGDDFGTGVALDPLGNIYVTGIAQSFNFPRTVGSFGQTFTSGANVFVTKINPAGSQILYSTNLRTSGQVNPASIAVDSRGNAYVVGTVGFDIPFILPANTIPGAITPTPVGPNVPGQENAYDSTYENGNLSYPAPGTRGATQVISTDEGFVTVLNSTATGLLLSSYIGGPANDEVHQIYLDSNNSAYISGVSHVLDSVYTPYSNYGLQSPGLPSPFITNLAFRGVSDIVGDGFLLKLRVGLPTLQALTLDPDQVAGGNGSTSTGTVVLRSAAPAGGVQVTVRALSPQVARLSPSGATSLRVTVPSGATTATFTIYTRSVSAPSYCDIRAEYDGDFIVSRLNVRPWLESFTVNTDTLPGGNTLQGQVTLFQPAPVGGLSVVLSTNLTDLVSFPVNPIVIPEGQQSVGFDIDTHGVSTPTDVSIQVAVDGVGQAQTVKLMPATVVNISFNPQTINGGEETTGTILLDGEAAAGAQITLSNTGHALTYPATLNLNPGDRQTTFTAKAAPLTTSTASSVVTATLNGSSTSGTLLIEGTDILAINLSSTSVLGGAVVQGSVTISRAASPSGFVIPLNNSNVGAGIVTPMIITIAPGQTTGNFTIQTVGVASTQQLIVSTNKTGYSNKTATLTVRALQFDLTLSPSTVPGGTKSIATITLRNGEVSPTGGISFSASTSDGTAATVPATVTLPAGAASVNFDVNTNRVQIDRLIHIYVNSPLGVSDSKDLIIQAPRMTAFQVSPGTLTGGDTATGTVTISTPAPTGGLTIELKSSHPSALQVPATVVIPANQTSVTFTVTTSPVAGRTTVTVTAKRDDDVKTATVIVNVPSIASVTFDPATVRGGSPSTGTVTLNRAAPTGGLLINLYADKTAYVTFPRTVLVPAGATSVNFTVNTTTVTREVAVIFTGEVNASAQTRTGTLYITPATSNRK